MKVLHICQRDDVATGGAVRVAYQLVNELQAQHIDAHILFVYGARGSFSRQLGPRAHYLGLTNSRDVIAKGWRLLFFILKFRPHIIHHHDGLIWTYLFTMIPTVRIVTHAHVAGGVRSFGVRTKVANWFSRINTDRLVCITEDTRKTWLAEGYKKNKTAVVKNAVDTDRYLPYTDVKQSEQARASFNLPKDAIIMGYLGRLHCAIKSTDRFLEVISHLPDSYHGMIVGEGEDEQLLKQQAQDLGLEDRVTFTGLVSDTCQAYHAMDAFVFTSHFEQFGLVILEAAACGLPVYTLKARGGVNEVLQNVKAYQIHDRSPKALADLIVRTEYDRKKPVENNESRELARRMYSWRASAEKLACEYQQLLGNNSVIQ